MSSNNETHRREKCNEIGMKGKKENPDAVTPGFVFFFFLLKKPFAIRSN